MRTVTALEVRAKFGQVLDEAAAGERFVVERGGSPVAAIVPLTDLDKLDTDKVRARRMSAVDRLVMLRRMDGQPPQTTEEIVQGLRADRASR